MPVAMYSLWQCMVLMIDTREQCIQLMYRNSDTKNDTVFDLIAQKIGTKESKNTITEGLVHDNIWRILMVMHVTYDQDGSTIHTAYVLKIQHKE